MQHSVILSVTAENKLLWQNDAHTAILNLLNAAAAQIELMLQAYHSREKVRKVTFDEGSLQVLSPNKFSLKADYVAEEYNICNAIDQVDFEKMTLSIALLGEGNAIEVKGIDLPEREPDSL